MKIYCPKYKGHELTQVCMYFSPGFEYSCLHKGIEVKQCPWGGKPWNQPTGYFVGPQDLIKSFFGIAGSEAPVEIP